MIISTSLLLGAPCSIYINLHYEAGTAVIPILWIRKPRFSVVTLLAPLPHAHLDTHPELMLSWQ